MQLKKLILGLGEDQKSSWTVYQVQNDTPISRNQKFVETNGWLENKKYPKFKNNQIFGNRQLILFHVVIIKKISWTGFSHGYFCETPECEFIINKQKHQIKKKFLGQNHYFSTRLPYAEKKITESFFDMVNTNYDTTEDKIIELQQLKGTTEMKFRENISD